ncbi:MAG: hypothetical protein E6J43_13695 [Chloroflexi bacterium]|nr:MAG: hypothetical protein E6J43_13695 [Chloroflexota bacterium]
MSLANARRYGSPILVNVDGAPIARPQRIPLSHKKISEWWLQDLIRRCPEILPVVEIEPAFSPLMSIGMEVPTSAGPIDNLYVSPGGYVTIAETKLWRNPEARREVVGQIIDYAKELRSWSYEDLENRVRDYNQRYRNGEIGLFESLRQEGMIEDVEEAAFVDSVNRNLENGRFLLLVVGDGIRESVEAMTEFLTGTPRLHFTLALVELEIYEMHKADRMLVIPHVLARTREITRAVVRVEGEAKSIQVGIDTQVATGRPIRRSPTLSEEDYFTQLAQRVDSEDVALAHKLIEDMEARGCIIDWKAASFVIKLPDPGESGSLLTLLVVQTDGKTYVTSLGDQLRRLGLPDQIAADYVRTSADALGVIVSPKDKFAWRGDVPLSTLRIKYADLLVILETTIEKIKVASQPGTEEPAHDPVI